MTTVGYVYDKKVLGKRGRAGLFVHIKLYQSAFRNKTQKLLFGAVLLKGKEEYIISTCICIDRIISFVCFYLRLDTWAAKDRVPTA